MYYAPILITTLNRYVHFVNCIESLQKNKWAQYTDLFIGLDFPPSEEYVDGFQKISKYLDSGINGFSSVTIIRREYNYGPSKNGSDLRFQVLEKYDRYIGTEDDNIFSPNFIEYMDKCLEYYYNDNSVIGVCGYSYMIDGDWEDDKSNILMNDCFYSAWGHGMWKHKFLEIQNEINIDNFRHYFKNKNISNKIKTKSLIQYYNLSNIMHASHIGICDTTLSIYMIVSEKMCIQPKKSLVRNCGWDGSGVNCPVGNKNLNFSMQIIDTSDFFELFPPNLNYIYNRNIEKINQSDPLTQFIWERTKIICIIIRLLGPKLYSKYYMVIETLLHSIKKIRYINRIYQKLLKK